MSVAPETGRRVLGPPKSWGVIDAGLAELSAAGVCTSSVILRASVCVPNNYSRRLLEGILRAEAAVKALQRLT